MTNGTNALHQLINQNIYIVNHQAEKYIIGIGADSRQMFARYNTVDSCRGKQIQNGTAPGVCPLKAIRFRTCYEMTISSKRRRLVN